MYGKMNVMIERRSRKFRRGWIRILESVIGVLIILLALIYFVSEQSKKSEKNEKANEIIKILLDEIENNVTLRQDVISENKQELDTAIRNFLNSYYFIFNATNCIKKPNALCNPGTDVILPDKEIFSGSRLISYINTTTGKVEAKKVVVYVWKK